MTDRVRVSLVLITQQKTKEKAQRVAEQIGEVLSVPVTYDVERYVCCAAAGPAGCTHHDGRWQVAIELEIAGESVLEASVRDAFRLLAPWTLHEPGPTRVVLQHDRGGATFRSLESFNVVESARWIAAAPPPAAAAP